MDRREVLAASSFGHRVAEEEADELLSYFVETDQWKGVFNGEVDIVYGVKGSGKTAIYSLIRLKVDELRGRGIEIISVTDVRSDPIFASVVSEPPTSEQEFRLLWKLYFVKLITEHLRDVGLQNDKLTKVERILARGNFIPYRNRLVRLFMSSLFAAKRLVRPEAVEGGIKLNPVTGQVEGFTGKLTFREPRADERARGIVSLDEVVRNLDAGLGEGGRSVWIIIDRLDAQFTVGELEANALKGLFRTYIDFIPLDRIDLKIFVRPDIWKKITSQGFREASQVTRHTTIEWNASSLLNLIIRRALHNEGVCDLYRVRPLNVLSDMRMQVELFYKLFPLQVDRGSELPTLEWMLSQVADGTGQAAPREVIHALSAAREVQLRLLELGEVDGNSNTLFDSRAVRDAMVAVSKVRYEQTLRAEFADSRSYFDALNGGQVAQSATDLARLWRCNVEKAVEIAEKLVEIGLFEKRQNWEDQFVVSRVYRNALNVRSTAISDASADSSANEGEV